MGQVTLEPIQIFQILGEEKTVQILALVALDKHVGTKTFLIGMYITRCIYRISIKAHFIRFHPRA